MDTLFIIGGAAIILMARMGWFDPGGVMRRLDWWGVYKLMDLKYVGGGARRANYLIGSTMLGIGVLMAVREALRNG